MNLSDIYILYQVDLLINSMQRLKFSTRTVLLLWSLMNLPASNFFDIFDICHTELPNCLQWIFSPQSYNSPSFQNVNKFWFANLVRVSRVTLLVLVLLNCSDDDKMAVASRSQLLATYTSGTNFQSLIHCTFYVTSRNTNSC